MSVAKNKKIGEQSRLNVRLSPEIKARVAKAATIIGQDLTEFAAATLRGPRPPAHIDEINSARNDQRFDAPFQKIERHAFGALSFVAGRESRAHEHRGHPHQHRQRPGDKPGALVFGDGAAM